MTRYVFADKEKITPLRDMVAILSEPKKRKRKTKSVIISRKGSYRSRTTPKKLAERAEKTEKVF